MTDQPATHGTATPVPNQERTRFNALAAGIGPNETCEVEDRDGVCNKPARFAILLLGTTSLDALNLECIEHATATPRNIDNYHDAGDTFAFILLPRF
jgi:hypothetical protein